MHLLQNMIALAVPRDHKGATSLGGRSARSLDPKCDKSGYGAGPSSHPERTPSPGCTMPTTYAGWPAKPDGPPEPRELSTVPDREGPTPVRVAFHGGRSFAFVDRRHTAWMSLDCSA